MGEESAEAQVLHVVLDQESDDVVFAHLAQFTEGEVLALARACRDLGRLCEREMVGRRDRAHASMTAEERIIDLLSGL